MSTKLRSSTIVNSITDMIRQGAFPEGKLWSEDILCERLDVSRTTLREALKLLERDGIISKKHGLANFIHASALDVRMRFDRFSDFRQLLEDGGYEVRVQRQVPRPISQEEMLAFTGKSMDGLWLYQETFCIVDDHPVSYARNCLMATPEVYAHYAATPPPVLHPLHTTLPFTEFMQRITGLEQAHTVIYLEPVLADAEIAAVMHLPEGIPLIGFSEEHYSLTDVLCGLGHVCFDPSVVKLAALRKWL